MSQVATFARGLEDVIAGESAISTVDGALGKLTYRGIDLRDLVKHSSFEETTYLLWHGSLPTRAQLTDLRDKLAAARALPAEILDTVRCLPRGSSIMASLRTLLSAMALHDPNADGRSPDNLARIATLLVARTGTIVAADYRLRHGQEPIAPDPALDYAANFLYMLTGKVPDELAAKVLDEALIMHAEHEFNASTFAVRVVVSTLSDMYSAIVAGVATLKGPAHGGANQDVMALLKEIQQPDRAEQVIKDHLAARRRIPGFGHRVYKTWDPRALILKQRSEDLARQLGDMRWLEISARVAQTVWQQKQLYPNVDFYSASAYHYLGIPSELFTPVFAISRMAGWTAHALEQYADNRLIRPRAEYTGPLEVPYIPIAQR